jgi:hypothetical protein
VPYENFVLNEDALANESVRRNLASGAYHCVLLYFYECSNLRFITDTATVKVDKLRMNDLHILP